jgi:type I restriction enzyme S subunit
MRFALVRSVAVLRPLIVHAEYVSSALRSPFLQEQVRGKSTQTAQSNIFQGKIRTLIFPLPPESEQQRIVQALEIRHSLLSSIVSQTAVGMRRTGSLRSSILCSAFSGKLVPQDPNDEPASLLLERIRSKRVHQVANKLARRPKARREKAFWVKV